MTVLEPEKWCTLETFLARQAEYMRTELTDIEKYFSEQTWSKKIIDYRPKFLSPCSIDPTKYFSDTSWYALQIVVQNPTDCYTILHDIGHHGDPNCIQA